MRPGQEDRWMSARADCVTRGSRQWRKSHGAGAMDVPQRMVELAGERDEAMCSTTACQGWSVDRSVNWGARNDINDLHFISADRRVRS
jgi:hypothetical protein